MLRHSVMLAAAAALTCFCFVTEAQFSHVSAAAYNYVAIPFAAEFALQAAPSAIEYGVSQSSMSGQPNTVTTTGVFASGMQISTSPVLTSSTIQNLTPSHTLALWVQFQSTITAPIQFVGTNVNAAAGAYTGHRFFFDSGNIACHWQSTSEGTPNSVSSGGYRLCTPPGAATPSTIWFHLAYTYDASTLQGSMYANGALLAQSTSTCGGTGCFQGNNVNPWAVGPISGTLNNGVLVNHIMFYNGVLSGTQLLTLMQHQTDRPDISVRQLQHFFPLNTYGNLNNEAASGERGKDTVTTKYSDAVFVTSHNQTIPFRDVIGYSEVNDRFTYFQYAGPGLAPLLWPAPVVGGDSYPKLPETLQNSIQTYIPNVRSVAWQFAQTTPTRSFSVGVLVGNEQFYDLPANDYILSVLSADGNTALHLRSSTQGSGRVCATASTQTSGFAVEIARVCTAFGQGIKHYDRTRLVLSYDDTRKSLSVTVSDLYQASLVRQSINWVRARDDTNHTVRFGQFDAKQRYTALRFMGVGVQNAPVYLNSTNFNSSLLFPAGYNSINLTASSADPLNLVLPVYHAPLRYSGSDRSGQNWSASFGVSNFAQNVSRIQVNTTVIGQNDPYSTGARIRGTEPYLLPYVIAPDSDGFNERAFWINIDNVTLDANTTRKWIFGSSNVRFRPDATGNTTYFGISQLGLWLNAEGRVCLSLFDVTLTCTFDYVVSNTWNYFGFRTFARFPSGTTALLYRNGVQQFSKASQGIFASWQTSGSTQFVTNAITDPTFDAVYTQIGPNGETAVTATYRYLIATGIRSANIKFLGRLLSYPEKFECSPELQGPFFANITRSCTDPQSTVLFVNDPTPVLVPVSLPVSSTGMSSSSTGVSASSSLSSSISSSSSSSSSTGISSSTSVSSSSSPQVIFSSSSSTASSSTEISSSSTSSFGALSTVSSSISSNDLPSSSSRTALSSSSTGSITTQSSALSSSSSSSISVTATASSSTFSSTASSSGTSSHAISSSSSGRAAILAAVVASTSASLTNSAIAAIVVASVIASAAAVGVGGYAVQTVRASRAAAIGSRMRRVTSEV